MRICVVRLGGMGDILLSTPTLRALAEHYQTNEIDYIVEPQNVDALTGIGYIRQVIPFDKRKDMKRAQLVPFVRALRAARYDLFLNLQPSLKTMLLSTLAMPKQTLVFRKDRLKQPDTGRVRHAIADFAKELKPLGIPVTDWQLDFFVPESARKSLAQKFDLSVPYVAMNPAGTRDVNRWPPAHFAELIMRLEGHRIVLLGGPGDVALAEEILSLAKVPVESVAGRLTIKELGALLERARCVVTGDTGPLHIASAVKAPLVCLSGAADPDRTGPTRPGDLVVIQRELDCVPCQARSCKRGDIACMNQLSVERVLAAVERQLQ